MLADTRLVTPVSGFVLLIMPEPCSHAVFEMIVWLVSLENGRLVLDVHN